MLRLSPMSRFAFFSDNQWSSLLPFGTVHAFGELRVGALKISEWWLYEVNRALLKTEQEKKAKVLDLLKNGTLNDRWIPSEQAFSFLSKLKPGQDLYAGDTLLYQARNKKESAPLHIPEDKIEIIARATDLFRNLDGWLTAQKHFIIAAWDLTLSEVPEHVTLLGPTNQIWIHPSAQLTACTLNSASGPIFIGPNVEIQEGANLRGPIAVGESTVVKMGTRIYGPTAIGPQCRIGGEVSNCAFFGYSNKSHDGFLGNSVIGKWCNLGADTNSSNLKSNYSEVRLWNETEKAFIGIGFQFCGVLMGDHSKCGINTMFDTGTIVGAGCNIYGGGFQPKHILPFSWGGNDSWELHDFDKFTTTARRAMKRRGADLSEKEIIQWKTEHDIARSRFD